MHVNAQRVQSALMALGAGGQVVEFADSTRTSAEAAAAIGTTVGQIAKTLVFLAGDQPVLVIASGTNRVAVDKLSKLLAKPITRPNGEAVKQVTGFPIGGVPPVGHPAPLPVVVDEDLRQYSEIWAAAGTPHAVFPTTPDELIRITGASVANIREEPPAQHS